jgi:hypothetical protein
MAKRDTKLVYETPLFVGQGNPPLLDDLTGKVYRGIYTLPLSHVFFIFLSNP